MKTAKNISYKAFLVILPVMLGACARDVEVVTKEQRAKLAAKRAPRGTSTGGTASGATSSGPTVKLGSFGATTFLVDKHAEIIDLFLSAQLPLKQKRTEVAVVFSTDPQQMIQAKTLKADRRGEIHGQYFQNRFSHWDSQLFFNQEGDTRKLSYLLATAESSKTTLDLAKKASDPKQKLFVNFFEDNAQLKARWVADNIYDLTFKSAGEMAIAKEGVTEKSPYVLQVSLRADFSQAIPGKVKILNSRAQFALKRAREFKVEVSTKESLVFEDNGRCPFVSGVVKLEQKAPNSGANNNSRPEQKVLPARVFNFAEGEITMEGNPWRTPVAPCLERPIVDYSKLLVF